jgi:hypothetical protein
MFPSHEEDGERPSRKRSKKRANQLLLYRERLEQLRPLLAQASASLLRGIIIQSRTVPSMAARIGNEEIPLDAEEDIGPQDDKEVDDLPDVITGKL